MRTLALLLLLPACDAWKPYLDGQAAEDCASAEDDDQDGLINMDDPDCWPTRAAPQRAAPQPAAPQPATPEPAEAPPVQPALDAAPPPAAPLPPAEPAPAGAAPGAATAP